MSIEETAYRIYTIFSQKMFAGRRTFRNLDLTQGRTNKARFLKLLSIIEDRYNGLLIVADVGALSGSYTVERIEAEVEIYQPDMFWVDYLTLLKAPNALKAEEWQSVATLSSGIKGIAMRHSVIGGCSAQVNREALKTKAFLPRLEHISFGDSIGHDADQVFSINRKADKLYYALIKNRLGPEIGRVPCRFDADSGAIYELPDEDDVESDD